MLAGRQASFLRVRSGCLTLDTCGASGKPEGGLPFHIHAWHGRREWLAGYTPAAHVVSVTPPTRRATLQEVKAKRVAGWAEETHGAFDVAWFKGGHFFPLECVPCAASASGGVVRCHATHERARCPAEVTKCIAEHLGLVPKREVGAGAGASTHGGEDESKS